MRDKFHRGEKEKEKKRNKKLLNCSVHLRISIGFARAKIYRGDIYIYMSCQTSIHMDREHPRIYPPPLLDELIHFDRFFQSPGNIEFQANLKMFKPNAKNE